MNERSHIHPAGPRLGDWHVEDFRVGQHWTTRSRVITDADIAAFAALSGDVHPIHTDPAWAATTPFETPIAHGPFGIAVAMGLLHELHLVDDTIVALLETRWSYAQPMRAGDSISADVLITGTRRTSDGRTGVVQRDVTLRNAKGQVVQHGSLPCMVRARGAGEESVERNFGTVPWAEKLAAVLAAREVFATATSTWDGSIGLVCGQRSVQLRIYRGRVIDIGARTPLGPTFTVEASPEVWTALATGPGNDSIRQANAGRLRTSGNAHEYIRLTKAVHEIWEAVRELASRTDSRDDEQGNVQC